MKRNRLAQLFCAVLLLTAMILPVRADMGPKPSVTIEVQGLEGRECWATLMAVEESTGPHSSMYWIDETGQRQRKESITPNYQTDHPEYPVWKAFADYELADTEGLYFLQFYSQVTEEETFRWGYYPPDEFKLLLYFPETESFLISDRLYERYAFDSYYTVDISTMELQAQETVSGLTLEERYEFKGELAGLAGRIALTIALELALALFLGLRSWKQVLVLVLVNLATQIGLNVALNIHEFFEGPGLLLALYLKLELAVLAAEIAAYTLLLPMKVRGRKKFAWVCGYAVAANLLSFVVGGWLSYVLPWPFIF